MAGERQSLGSALLSWLDRFVNWWSAAAGAGVLTAAGVTAWAAWAADLVSVYQPFSWVAAGFLGAIAAALVFLVVQWGVRLRVRSRFDIRNLAGPSPVNPLEKTFVNRRIFVNEFVLPSNQVIAGKSFIDCEIVGPANLYWWRDNNATALLGPQMDAVYLDPDKKFVNGVALDNCIFRGCSFQRITLFVGARDYQQVKDHAILNWISETPETIATKIAQPPLIDLPDPPGFRPPEDNEGKHPPESGN